MFSPLLLKDYMLCQFTEVIDLKGPERIPQQR